MAMDETWKVLIHPFASGALEMPGEGRQALFLGARPGVRMPEDFSAALHTVQSFRPHFLALREEGFVVAPRAEGEGYDLALILCGRHRERNEAHLAEALLRTRPGSVIVVGGSKAEGVASLRKRVGSLMAIEGSLSKYHGVAFWLHRPDNINDAVLALRAERALVEGRYETAAGSFSHDKIDPGSALFACSLPHDLQGDIADFCAGWGYLSAELLARNPPLARLDLYEADYESLEAARRNLVPYEAHANLGFYWLDLIDEPVGRHYDIILMNPPFHQGRATEPSIGREMIRAAARALKPGGRLILVANRPLPYEGVLAEAFSAHGELARDDSFKVLWGRR